MARPETAENMFLMDGRFIDENDYINERRVAVIRADIASLRGLEVGDSIDITMRNFPLADEYVVPDFRRGFPVPSAGRVLDRQEIIDFDAFRRAWSAHPTDARGNRIGIMGGGIEYGGVLFYDFRSLDEVVALEMATGYITDQAKSGYWRELETQVETFEIVGIYGTTDRRQNLLTISRNDVFIPDSVVPSDWEQGALFRNYGIVLNSPAYEQEFLLRYQARLDEMGFWLTFADSGWDSFISAVGPIQDGILIGAGAFAVLTLIVCYLIVFLYYAQRRREFAIQRALGARKHSVIRGTTLPILFIGMAGLLGGVIPAWHFSLDRARGTLEQIEGAVFTSPPILWLYLLAAVLFGLILMFTIIESSKLARLSALELLQGGASGKRKAKSKKKHGSHGPIAAHGSSADWDIERFLLPDDGAAVPRRGIGFVHIAKNLVRNIVRKPAKSLLAFAVAAGFMAVLSWMPVSIERDLEQIEWLFDNTEITGTIVVDPAGAVERGGGVPHRELARVLDTGFIADYLAEVEFGFMRLAVISPDLPEQGAFEYEFISVFPMLGISNLDMHMEFYESEMVIEYTDGFGLEIFTEVNLDEPVIIVPEFFMQGWGVELGDYLGFSHQSERCPETGGEIIERGDIVFYRVVGVHRDSEHPSHLITPLGHLQRQLPRAYLQYDVAEFVFDPAMNREMDAFREEVEHIMVQVISPQLIFVLRDHILRDVVEPLSQNITMMQALYPIVLGLSILIAAGLTALLLLPSMKEAATMRAVGVTRLRVLAILGFEQVTLCLIGLAFGAMAWFTLEWVNLFGAGLYLIGCFVAAVVFSLVLANRKPLELLQVKE